MPLVCEVCGTEDDQAYAEEMTVAGVHLHVCAECVQDRRPFAKTGVEDSEE